MHMNHNQLKSRSHSGYSLLELSIVILIIALIAGSGVVVGKATLDSTQNVSTNNRLNVIETALLAFRLTGNRLPCPADGTLTPSSANFGKEAANIGDCTGGVPAANFSVTTSGVKTVEGVVPVRTLNLPDEFMYDGWGRKIAYSVWAPMTAMRSFINYGITFNCGAMAVRDASGNLRSNNTDYVLLSYGLNGHGAYTVQGTKYSSGSVNTDEQLNCHCNASAANTGYSASYVLKDTSLDATNALNSYDDLVRYKERWQLQSYADQNNPYGGLTCPQELPGFRVDGANASDRSGHSVAVGDINGDAIPDMIIGAPFFNSSAGAVYVVFGTKKGFPNPYAVSTLTGTNGFRIDGVTAGDQVGYSVSAGDVNGDGISDVIIGANLLNTNRGAGYVVFGSRTAWAATFALSALTGANGARFEGVIAGGNTGFAVGSGDVNGDGYSDIIIGTPYANTNSGIVYTVFGASTYSSATYTLDANVVTGVIDAAATKGFAIEPIGTDDLLGSSIAVGDTNGDGFADIVMGHTGYTGNIGLASIVMGKGRGKWKTPMRARFLNGFNGWHAFGKTSGDKFGASVAIGDVNGDAVGDIIIGAPDATAGGNALAGVTYVLLGNNSHKRRQFYTDNINSYNGYEIYGIAAGNRSGTSVAVGDINADGIGDVVIGAPYTTTSAGATYVVFGSRTTPGVTFNLSALNGTNGFTLAGAVAGELLGWSAVTGDVNGDGKSDVITGARGSARSGFALSGSTYIYFGQKRTSAWTNPYNVSGL